MKTTFHWPVKVYYEDTDAGGIVYYANYLKFFERARTEWLGQTPFNNQVLRAQYHCLIVVKSCAIEYHATAKLEDQLDLQLVLDKLGRASCVLSQQAYCAGKLIASAQVKLAFIDADTMAACAIPKDLYSVLAAGMS